MRHCSKGNTAFPLLHGAFPHLGPIVSDKTEGIRKGITLFHFYVTFFSNIGTQGGSAMDFKNMQIKYNVTILKSNVQ